MGEQQQPGGQTTFLSGWNSAIPDTPAPLRA